MMTSMSSSIVILMNIFSENLLGSRIIMFVIIQATIATVTRLSQITARLPPNHFYKQVYIHTIPVPYISYREFYCMSLKSRF